MKKEVNNEEVEAPRHKTLEQLTENEPKLQNACELAQKAHAGQMRAEGTPYYSHLVEVARIIYEEWGIDDLDMVIAAVLHDTVEDTKVNLEEIRSGYGQEVAELVSGMTQFRSEKSDPESKKAADKETIRKGVKNNLINPKNTVLKLADRLHNMRTLSHMPEAKRVAKSWETIEIYAKMAESLGMWKVKTELENLSFQYTDPKGFEEYSKLVSEDKRVSKRFVDNMVSSLNMLIIRAGVEASIEPKINSLARLKDKSDDKTFFDINDVVSFRVAVKDEDSEEKTLYECYKLLAAIQKKFKDIEDRSRFDNFYIEPKENGYSAIQVTLKTPYGAVEIAITSETKEEFNNWGIVSMIRNGTSNLQDHALKLIFTPTGQVKFFNPDDRGIDFAYSISEEMGAQAESILVNGEDHDVSYVLPNGAEVEVKIGENRIAPDMDVINFASPKTKRIIEKQFSELEIAEQEKRGKEIVTDVISERGLLNLYDVLRLPEYSKKIVDMLFLLGSKNSLPKLYRRVGKGLVTPDRLKRQLDEAGITKGEMGITSILIEGPDNPGLLNYFTSEIEKQGGNIRRNYGESSKNSFTEHFVIEKLTEDQEHALKEEFQKDARVKKIIIV